MEAILRIGVLFGLVVGAAVVIGLLRRYSDNTSSLELMRRLLPPDPERVERQRRGPKAKRVW